MLRLPRGGVPKEEGREKEDEGGRRRKKEGEEGRRREKEMG